MKVQIEIPDELAKRAKAAGLDVPKLVKEIMEDTGQEILEESIEDRVYDAETPRQTREETIAFNLEHGKPELQDYWKREADIKEGICAKTATTQHE